MDFFNKDKRTALQSIEYAQHLAFAPIAFQAARSLKVLGILQTIENNVQGLTLNEIVQKTNLPQYGVRVLVEAGLGIGLLIVNHEKYTLTKTGYFILSDAMTIANMDFVHDICYKGMFDLDKSIVEGKPEGLKTLGSWKTVYEGLSQLKPHEQKSWFDFDHFYSSDSFPKVLPHVFKNNPKRLLDIGGNTGKWALQCCNYSNEVQVSIADLPGQLNMAKTNIAKEGFANRVSYYEMNILNPTVKLPKGHDVIWMSQFLDCFSEEEIVSILSRCHEALDENGQVFIMETFWNCQSFEAAAFSLQMTSLYFTNIANGNSQMYHSELFESLIKKAGFKILERIDGIGVSHSLLKCDKL